MIITYYGAEFFKVQFGETVLGFNPPSKKSKYKAGRFGADIALSTLNHDDFNGVESLSLGDKEPFVISGPGEYEVKGITVKGLPSTSLYDVAERTNTLYLVTLEGMTLCFLGALGSTELPSETTEALDEIDILFVPIQGDGLLSPAEAYKFAVKLEPKVIIPMYFTNEKDASLKQFLKEAGEESLKGSDKLTLKPKDILDKTGAIEVLLPQS